jgi:hypothetical protein
MAKSTRAGTSTQGIAELAPQTDHILTITGLAPGETKMYIFSDKGDRIYSATLNVTPENGHIVRIYGGAILIREGIPAFRQGIIQIRRRRIDLLLLDGLTNGSASGQQHANRQRRQRPHAICPRNRCTIFG